MSKRKNERGTNTAYPRPDHRKDATDDQAIAESKQTVPVDWYEAFADAVHSLGKKWPDELTDDEEAYCEVEADKVATRPESER